MTIIASIDGPARRIYLHADTVGVEFQPMDMYKEMRTLRASDESLRKYDLFLAAYGKVPKGGGKFTERYVQCLLGTRVVPHDTEGECTIIGTIITDDGQEGIACFDRSSLINQVDFNYLPPQVEVIEVDTGGSFSIDDRLLLADVHGQVARELWYDSAAVVDGNGYQQTPHKILNNLIDHAEADRITTMNIYSDITLARDLKNIKVTGIGMPTFDAAGYDLKGMEFWHLQFEGLSTSPFIIQQCNILQGAGIFGQVELCTFDGDAELTGPVHIIEGISNKPGANYVTLDTNGFTLQVTNWHRSLGISGMISGVHTVEMYGGQLHLDASCTGGIIHLRGSYSLPPNNLGTTTIIDGTESKKTLDNWQFKGLDPDNSIVRSGDGITNEVLTVDGKELTITPTEIIRTS